MTPRPDAKSYKLQVVEYHMMDMRRYLPLTALSGCCVRALLYPTTLIRTRLQVQRHHAYYHGTFDAFVKIIKHEGFRGLYRGFGASNLLVTSQLSYLTTYESIRHQLAIYSEASNQSRSFIAGGIASFVAQIFLVPIDIVTQHLQVLGDLGPKPKSSSITESKFTNSIAIASEPYKVTSSVELVKAIYKREGVRGFYKGYVASLMVYAPSSAIWWLFYDVYCNALCAHTPDWTPALAVQCTAAPLSGVTASVLTNPLDAVRTRIQVQHTTFGTTARTLWKEERTDVFRKGLSARVIQSVPYSFFLVLGYETIKRWSLLNEYKDSVAW